ncbi:MAG: isoleucine--tRNA ligase [Chthonomonadales bacterium]
MDYKKTLNITLSDKDPGAMPQRANLPALEPRIQKRWDEIDLYHLSLEKEAPLGTFILHDGPPYSNGDIHLGHALNKIAKDIIVKFRTMQGYRAPYVPGWDNHGMPIENEVAKELRRKGMNGDRITVRQHCRTYAAKWVTQQKEQFKRLGVRGDWENPYLTMSTEFEAKIVEIFGDLAEKGYIYRGLKPVLWCGRCETALADAEVEYAEHNSRSIWVRFPVMEDPRGVVPGRAAKPSVIIWTTTPWTIPANLAVAAHPDADYAWVEVGGETWLLAADLVRSVMDAVGRPEWTILARQRGADLEGLVTRHPLFDRPSPMVLASYVTMEDGTGLVHTAPGHGKEDFDTGQRYGLEVLCPVDAAGVFTEQAGEEFAGAHILGGEADGRVIEALKRAGNLVKEESIRHSYPHCWRCHNPLIFRATVQWFMSVDHEDHRRRALEAIQRVRWFPPVSVNRISAMVSTRPDWCLSRQRAWGVGIPAFYCTSCRREILDRRAIDAVRDLVAREGSDAWYTKPAEEILPEGYRCPSCGGRTFDKETDILDVWFDSGSTSLAVLENPRWPELRWPADLYLEGSDQHRGWFNSSLMIAVAERGRAPYEQVVTCGWTLDEEGRAMHKSWGNAVSPSDVTDRYGADILRLWVASTDYFEDVRCSENILKQVAEAYRRIRNTFRFLVNNLHDFDVASDAVPLHKMLDLDLWVLGALDRVVATSRAAYDVYEFHRVFHSVHQFCAVELSSFYLDVLKDRLYCEGKHSVERRSAQTALHRLADTMARLLAPILSHTAEEVWGYLRIADKPLSVQLARFPESDAAPYAEAMARIEPVINLREQVNLAVEAARQSGVVVNPLEAAVCIWAEGALLNTLRFYEAQLPAIFKVSQVVLKEASGAPRIEAARAEGVKCARCWLVKADVGSDAAYPDICGRCARVVRSF